MYDSKRGGGYLPLKEFYSKANYAFTLAEVLITLGIIGVVAAITVPSLVSNYQDKLNDTKYKKARNILINGYKLMLARHEVFDVSQLPFVAKLNSEENDAIGLISSEHSEVFKILKDNAGGSYSSTLPTNYVKSESDEELPFNWNNVPYIFSVSDGMLFGIEKSDTLNNFYVYADTNGTANPNKLKKDLYKFSVSGNAEVLDVSDDLTQPPCTVENFQNCMTSEACIALINLSRNENGCLLFEWRGACRHPTSMRLEEYCR